MFQKLIEKIASNLDAAHVPYMIIGGQAVLLYAEPRLTKDIDVTLGLEPADADRLIGILPAIDCLPLVDDPREFLRDTFVLPVVEKLSQLRVDFVFSLSEYERLAISRACPVQVGSINVNYISVEDLLIHKIIAGRPRDLEDAKSILAKNRMKIPMEYVKKWLGEFDSELGTDCMQVLLSLVGSVTEVNKK